VTVAGPWAGRVIHQHVLVPRFPANVSERSEAIDYGQSCKVTWGILGVVLLLAACNKQPEQAAIPPVEVDVITIELQDAANIVTLPGREHELIATFWLKPCVRSFPTSRA
jgi:hypothetical protein